MTELYTPQFKCQFCGESSSSILTSPDSGVFVPCGCAEARKHRDQEHYLRMERRKQARRKK